jgi:hypothetical protein
MDERGERDYPPIWAHFILASLLQKSEVSSKAVPPLLESLCYFLKIQMYEEVGGGGRGGGGKCFYFLFTFSCGLTMPLLVAWWLPLSGSQGCTNTTTGPDFVST